jgi:HSP20 family molecular chaperone IbpA
MSNNQSLTQTQPQSMARVEQRSFMKPPCDVYENVDEFLLVADLPGVAKEDLRIQVERDEMFIEAHRQHPQVQGKQLSTEYTVRDYHRHFALPAGVETEKVKAELRDGLLWVHLPKSEAIKPRQIPIS